MDHLMGPCFTEKCSAKLNKKDTQCKYSHSLHILGNDEQKYLQRRFFITTLQKIKIKNWNGEQVKKETLSICQHTQTETIAQNTGAHTHTNTIAFGIAKKKSAKMEWNAIRKPLTIFTRIE